MGRQFGLLQDYGDVGVYELEACLHDLQKGFVEQVDRAGAFPLWIVVGKHAADVTQPGGAEDRVGDRMGHRVGVGMAGEPFCIGDLHPAEDQLATRGEGV